VVTAPVVGLTLRDRVVAAIQAAGATEEMVAAAVGAFGVWENAPPRPNGRPHAIGLSASGKNAAMKCAMKFRLAMKYAMKFRESATKFRLRAMKFWEVARSTDPDTPPASPICCSSIYAESRWHGSRVCQS
jgi:hypothetical protein